MDGNLTIELLENEYWWFGQVNAGHLMPFDSTSDFCGSLTDDKSCDQFAPIAISSKGRYVWCECEFDYCIKNGVITFFGKGADKIRVFDGHKNLKGAYLAAMKAHFPFCGKTPNLMFLEKPQYNTWIQLNVNQTQEDILKYAEEIIANGLPAGILMIDNGWQENFGTFEFNARKIPNPKLLTEKLHAMGFKVMLWVTPIVACAGKRFMELCGKNYLVKNKNGEPAIRRWWDGYSAVMDFSNPQAVEWYCNRLESLKERYGIDGFKFDAGDIYFYADCDMTFGNVSAREQTKLFNIVGEKFSFNEFRAAWNCGGRPIVARLHDKRHTWDGEGLNLLIPHTLVQGLSGYAFCCPDMLGGGAEGSFEKGYVLDDELFVRWAQANALMGMLQISLGFWDIFKNETVELITQAIKLHEKLGKYCAELAEKAAVNGEPIVRPLEYEFPNQGYEKTLDMFMLGDKYLAVPILKKGQTEKSVCLPKGFCWQNDMGTVFKGGTTVNEKVPLNRILYYKKISD